MYFNLKSTVVTTKKSRKKYQQEILQKALNAEEKSKITARESFFLTRFPYLQNSSYEHLLHQIKDEQDEGNFHGQF